MGVYSEASGNKGRGKEAASPLWEDPRVLRKVPKLVCLEILSVRYHYRYWPWSDEIDLWHDGHYGVWVQLLRFCRGRGLAHSLPKLNPELSARGPVLLWFFFFTQLGLHLYKTIESVTLAHELTWWQLWDVRVFLSNVSKGNLPFLWLVKWKEWGFWKSLADILSLPLTQFSFMGEVDQAMFFWGGDSFLWFMCYLSWEKSVELNVGKAVAHWSGSDSWQLGREEGAWCWFLLSATHSKQAGMVKTCPVDER